MKISKLKIKTKSKSYNIFFGDNIITKLSSILKSENIRFDRLNITSDEVKVINVPQPAGMKAPDSENDIVRYPSISL